MTHRLGSGRRAINGLLVEVVEDHERELFAGDTRNRVEEQPADELIALVHGNFK